MRDVVLWDPASTVLPIGERIEAASEQWEVLHVPGHADGHIALLGIESRRLLSADLVLATITPNIGYHPESRADPLGDYLASLDRVVEIDPTLIVTGHHETIEDGADRARAIAGHHGDRLKSTRAALTDGALSGYDISRILFGDDLSSHGKRFAVAETLSHLVRLEHDGIIERDENGAVVTWQLA
jgi:glyoxylase-like metal-dependent hydrolase (beta-lactamase superfamily II)